MLLYCVVHKIERKISTEREILSETNFCLFIGENMLLTYNGNGNNNDHDGTRQLTIKVVRSQARLERPLNCAIIDRSKTFPSGVENFW